MLIRVKGEGYLPRCIQTGCEKEGKYALITLDYQTVYVCEDHLKSWIESGAVIKEPFSQAFKRASLNYMVPSVPFFASFILLLVELFVIIGVNRIPTLTVFEGFLALFICWIIALIVLRKAYSAEHRKTIYSEKLNV